MRQKKLPPTYRKLWEILAELGGSVEYDDSCAQWIVTIDDRELRPPIKSLNRYYAPKPGKIRWSGKSSDFTNKLAEDGRERWVKYLRGEG